MTARAPQRRMLPAFYSPLYFFPLPTGHPFPMEKFPQAHDMLLRGGFLQEREVEIVGPIDRERLERVHTPAYLDRFSTGKLDPAEVHRLGLPVSPALYERSATEVQGTVRACHAALEFGAACALAGGTHHAFPDRGEGFCALNDVAVAVRDLQHHHPGIRVLVLDTDAHQGNGTHAILTSDPNVFTYSIHVGRNYPSRKVPGDLDVPLERFASGPDYLTAFDASLKEVEARFACPDITIWISGADPHRNDRFGQLMLNVRDMNARDERVVRFIQSQRSPVALLYGGGYNRQATNTARLHRNSVVTLRRILGV